MNSILITGGAGFIGSYFVKEMLDHHIVVLDKLTYAGDKSRLSSVISSIEFIEGDICDATLLEELFSSYKFKYVVNFAAESHVDRSIENATEFIRTNVMGVQHLMDVCMKYFDDTSIFLQISTDEVYGPSGGLIFDESSPMNPKNPYAASKASAEHLIKSYENTYGFRSIITRSTNNYGASQDTEKLIPKVLESIVTGMDIPIYGDGGQKRSWLHVKDHVKIIREVLLEGHINEIYNISGKMNCTNLELVNKIIRNFEKLGHPYEGEIIFVEDRLGHDSNYLISDNKVTQDRIDFEDGLTELVKQSLLRK